MTAAAFDKFIPGARYVLALAVVLFAYSTMISWSYYGERCWSYLFGDRSSMVYRLLFLTFTFFAGLFRMYPQSIAKSSICRIKKQRPSSTP